jgi:hypothetical protein
MRNAWTKGIVFWWNLMDVSLFSILIFFCGWSVWWYALCIGLLKAYSENNSQQEEN